MANIMPMYGMKKPVSIHIKKFCIDDPVDRTEYEELLMKQTQGRVKILGEPDRVFSHRDNAYYIVVEWSSSE